MISFERTASSSGGAISFSLPVGYDFVYTSSGSWVAIWKDCFCFPE